MRMNERMKKALSILLCVLMLVQYVPTPAFAATTAEDGLCAHHAEHTAECGYAAAVAGQACTHKHSEDCYAILACVHTCGDECDNGCTHECTVDSGCITMELDCHHTHGDCGYSEGTAEVPCGHRHDESCGYAEAVAGTPCANAETDPECDHTGDCGFVAAAEGQPCTHTEHIDCGYQKAAEGTPCTHACKVIVDSDASCYKLLCSHKDGGHDDACGYVPAVEARDCRYECTECADSDVIANQSADWCGNPLCSQEDAFHVTSCAQYVAPEKPECKCAEKCTEINVWCDVCGVDYSKCTGTDTAAAYDAVASGDCGAEGDNLKWALTGDETNGYTLTITGSGAMADYDNYAATPWTAYRNSITSLSIGEGVTTIGDCAFACLSKVESVTIPASVTTLGLVAFGSSGLKTVTFAAGSRLTTIDFYAFENCYELTEITIPAGVTSIGYTAFSGCSALTDIHVAADNTAYKDIDGVLCTADGTTLVRYPEGKSAHVTTPEGVTIIRESAFERNDKLKTVTFSEGVTTIGDCAFLDCENLTEVTLPASVNSIGDWAFDGCPSLTTVNVPCSWDSKPLYTFDEGVVKIADHNGGEATCTKQAECAACGERYGDLGDHSIDITTGKCGVCGADMTVATVTDGTNTYYAADADTLNQAVTAILGKDSRTFTVNLPADAPAEMFTAIRRALIDTDAWGINLTLAGVTAIPNHNDFDPATAIFGPVNGDEQEVVTQLASIHLPDVVTIGGLAFCDCENLASVTAPKVRSIGKYAFDATALTSVEFPEATTIGVGAFSGCPSLATVKLPRATSIDRYAFTSCDRITYLELTAAGDIYIDKNALGYPTTFSGNIDLVLNANKKDAVSGTQWNGFTFKSITFACADGTTNHDYTYTANADGLTHTKACAKCGLVKIASESHSTTAEGDKAATCTAKAYCSVCDSEYGEVDAHRFGSSETCTYGCGTRAGARVNDLFNGNANYYYATLSEALAAAEKLNNDGVNDDLGVYVYPLADDAGDFTIPSGITFNGEGHTFSGAVTNEGNICGGTFNDKVINNGYIYNDFPGDIELGENFAIENHGTIDCKYHFWKDGTCRLCAVGCIHDGSYSAEGNVITDRCIICGGTLGTATLTAEGKTYDGTAFTAAVTGTGTLADTEIPITYCCEGGCIRAGEHTASITLGEITASANFTIEKRELTLSLTNCYKGYDGTKLLTSFTTRLEGFVFYDEGSYNEPNILDYDDVYDDVAVDAEKLTVILPDSAPGAYTTATVSGITLTGETAGNYTIAATLENVPISGYSGGEFEVTKASVTITSLDQNVEQGAGLDQNAYTVSNLPDGHTVSGVFLEANGSRINVNTEKIVITNAEDVDVTEYFDISVYSEGILTETCLNHSFNADGFCAAGLCNVYEPAKRNDNGTEDEYDDYYEISNAGQLYWFAQRVNEYGENEIRAVLVADITVPEGREWKPILNFYGNFDGNYKTVSGLYVKSEGQWTGFFGGGGYSYGTIRNLHLSNSYFEGDSAVGGIAGYHAGTIENCFVDDTVTVKGNSYVGALVGDFAGTMSNCYAYAPVLTGYSVHATLENCYYLSETATEDGGKTAAQFASGEVAWLLQGEQTDHIWGQTCGVGLPTLGGAKVYRNITGGCCKENYIYAYSNTAADPVIIHSFDDNGFCKYCDAYESAYQNGEGIYEISNAGQLYWFAQQVNNGNTAINGKLRANIDVNPGFVFNADGSYSYNGMEGPFGGGIAGLEPPREWTPIGHITNGYTGTFDGGDFTVSGLHFNDSGTDYVGLFGYVGSGGKVQNVGVVDSYLCGRNDVGGVVGGNYVSGTGSSASVIGCWNTGTVTGNSYVGGVVGYNNHGTVTNCHNTGEVNGSSNVGGVVGYNYGKGNITNCCNEGTVTGSGMYVGGVVGENTGTVTDCYNTGGINGSNEIGGVVGRNYIGTITNSYNTGAVSGNDNVGGVVGYNYAYGLDSSTSVTNCYNTGAVSGNSYVGGVAGLNDGGTVTNCCNEGTVTGSGMYVGGVVGENYGIVAECSNTGSVTGENNVGGVVSYSYGTISNCYNTGAVIGGTNVGGVVGRNFGTTSNCYNTGAVHGGWVVGGVAGWNDGGTVTNCYYLNAVSGVANPDGINGSDVTGSAEARNADQFASGEVAYLLQSGVEPGEDGTIPQVWGQNIDNGGENQGSPVFSDAKVYYGYISCADDAEMVYSNKEFAFGIKGHLCDFTTGECILCGTVAEACVRIGEEPVIGYMTIEEALLAVADCTAEDQAIVKMFKDRLVFPSATYEPLVINSGVFTLDLNGRILSGASLQEGVLRILGGDVTLTSSVPGGELRVDHDGTGAIDGGPSLLEVSGEDTRVTVQDVKIALSSKSGRLCSAISVKDADLTLDGVTIDSEYLGIQAEGCNLEVIGGSISADVMPMVCTESTVALRDGVTFPGGIKYFDFGKEVMPLNSLLGKGMIYWQNNAMLELADDAMAIPGGTVTVKARCSHEDGSLSLSPVPLENGTQHGRVYSCCGMVLEAENHTPDATGHCTVCGAECPHTLHDPEGVCTACGKTVGHSYDENGVCQVCEDYKNPQLVGGVYEIYTVEHLYWFAEQVNSGNNAINGRLMNDIVVNEGPLSADSADARPWIPIGIYESLSTLYTGTFDGQGHTVSGLYFNDSTAQYVGMFGVIYGGTVKNLGVINSWFCGYRYVGGVAGGIASGTVINCYNAGYVSDLYRYGTVGGIVGSNEQGEIVNCYNTGDVNGMKEVGGIAGRNYIGKVINCYNTGNLSSKDSVGGVAGWSNSGFTIKNCYYLSDAETEDGGKTEAQFASGEVAWLLSQGCIVYDSGYSNMEDDSTVTGEFYSGDIWGQKLGTDLIPVLGGPKVYPATNCKGEAGYSNTENAAGAHSHGAPVYTWSEDPIKLTVSVTCTTCGEILEGSTTDMNVTTSDDGLTTTYTATVTLDGKDYTGSHQVTNTIVSVNITWGDMQFTYTDGTGWDKPDAAWVKVENTGNTDVNVAYTYEKAREEITGSFSDGTSTITDPVTIAPEDSKQVWLRLDGRPSTALNNTTIGTVKLTIE